MGQVAFDHAVVHPNSDNIELLVMRSALDPSYWQAFDAAAKVPPSPSTN